MFTYVITPQFDQNTGLPIAPTYKRGQILCDYTGDPIYVENPSMLGYTIVIKYSHDSEPLWYEDCYTLQREFPDIFEYDLFYSHFSQFVESPYHFEDGAFLSGDASLVLISEWIQVCQEKNISHYLWNRPTVQDIFLAQRLHILRKLLSDKTYTAEQLGFIKQ